MLVILMGKSKFIVWLVVNQGIEYTTCYNCRCEANSKKNLTTLIKEVDLILLKFDLKLNY